MTVKCARTRRHCRDLVIGTVEQGISNGRAEGLDTKVRLIVRRVCGSTPPTPHSQSRLQRYENSSVATALDQVEGDVGAV